MNTSALPVGATALKESISVILPVRNAQSTLAQQTSILLEMLTDSAHCFELLIVDDASTDQTAEVAHELSRVFPQVAFISHSKKRGRQAAVESGLTRASYTIVLVHDDPVVYEAGPTRSGPAETYVVRQRSISYRRDDKDLHSSRPRFFDQSKTSDV